MPYLKRLKIILQHNIIYYVVLFIALFSYFINSRIEHISTYNSFNNERFIITGITKYNYGVKLDLKGKEKVIGYIYDENYKCNYKLGDIVIITGTIKEISNNTVPNTFNYKKYLANNKIYNVIIINRIKLVKQNQSILYILKNKLIQRGKKLKKSYPYIEGLIFGINSYIDESVMDSYRANGISHLFAISGLHVSLFILILSKILDKFRIKIGFKSFIIILFLLFYMFLTNFSMSVMRCSIFTILLLINKQLKIDISNTNLLLLTLSIILFINPLSLNNVGLQYSFLVTFSLLKYSYLINGNKIKQLLTTSLIAFLVSYPITVNNFYQVNIFSILYNLLFVPYVSFILLPMTLLTYAIPSLDNILYFLIKIIETASQFLEQFKIDKVILCKMNTVFVVLYFVIICKLFNKKNRKKKALSMILILFLIIHYIMPWNKDNYILFLDVGQGDSTIISINNKTSLIDTGGITTYGNEDYKYPISKNKTIPYLKSKGIRKIDNLILTHGDFDHMGEAKYLVENFKVDKVIFNCGEFNYLEKELIKVLDERNIEYKSCINKLNVDGTSLKFLQTGKYDNENDNSNVIYSEIDNKKFLFMGDAGVDKELDILNKYDIFDIDVLKIGHHGSRTSSGKEFINETNPKYSIISVGKNNRYGHPNREVLYNLKESKIYRTDQDGSIMFKIKNNRLKIDNCSP